jgi:hypothetical protein
MKKKIVISGPILSRSGYGEMARFAYRSLKEYEDNFDIYVLATNWGATGNIFELNEEKKEIDSLIIKTQQYIQQNNNQLNFDISIQVTIPNEWKKIAAVNIGYTAGIETNAISPAWLQPSLQMDKIIVISEHAKAGFINSIFGDQQGNQYKVTTPVNVCHFPVRDFKNAELDLNLKNDFNFLTVCQWSARKNLEQTISAFIEEFSNEDVGLVLKINTANDSLLDQEHTEIKLKQLLLKYPNRKCSVHLLHGHMSETEMQALYKHPKIKAVVSSTHGEGFGFPMFEASYNELPVIATDWSGHLDFLTMKDEEGVEKKMFAKVDYELNAIAQEHTWQGVLEQGTAWAYPRASHFKSRMREVFKDYPRFKSWAKKLNKWVRTEFEAEKVYTKFAELIHGEKFIKVNIEDLPKISIVSSVYDADEYIENFLKNITEQTIFDRCELILINANSPGNEEPVIKKYMEKYPNIVYKKLDEDPGIYGVWNTAIKMASGEFITNANMDDRKSIRFLEELGKNLFANKDVDLVYADNLVTNSANETFESNTSEGKLYVTEEFSLEAMLRGNPPHCMPMWRKSLHDKFGYFEEKYRSASDWEFWLRCAFGGSKFYKLNKPLGLYYFNPKGVSTNVENFSWKQKEEKEIFMKYFKLMKENKKKEQDETIVL